MTTTPQRGRPRLPAGTRRDVRITLKLTTAEARQLRAAARAAGQTLSDFLARRRPPALDLRPNTVDSSGAAPID